MQLRRMIYIDIFLHFQYLYNYMVDKIRKIMFKIPIKTQIAIFLITLILNSSYTLSKNKVTQIKFSKFNEEPQWMFKFFSTLHNGFYVDIGPTHPLYQSDTAYLKALGWKGINVESDPQVINIFYGINPDDTNVNYVVSSSALGLIQIPITGTFSALTQQVTRKTVPSIGLDFLCKTYYYKRPNLIIIDMDRMDISALFQNSWTTHMCKPDSFLLKFNASRQIGVQNEVTQLFRQQQYDLVKKSNNSLFYVDKDRVQIFKELQKQSLATMKDELVFRDFQKLTQKLSKLLPEGNDLGSKSYNIFNSSVYLHTGVKGQNIDINSLQRYSNQIVQNSQLYYRPIIIFNFDPRLSTIFLSGSYNVKEIIVQKVMKYIEIRLKYDGIESLVYIYDHGYMMNGLKIIQKDLISKPVEEIAQANKAFRQTPDSSILGTQTQEKEQNEEEGQEEGQNEEEGENEEEGQKEGENDEEYKDEKVQIEILGSIADDKKNKKEQGNKVHKEEGKVEKIIIPLNFILIISALVILITLLITKLKNKNDELKRLQRLQKKHRNIDQNDEEPIDNYEHQP